MISFLDNDYSYYDLDSCNEVGKPFNCQWVYNSDRLEIKSMCLISGFSEAYLVREVQISSDSSKLNLTIL